MDPRYCDPVIANTWSRRKQIWLWTRVELAWIRQHSETAWMAAGGVRIPMPDEVSEREATVHHEFVAFLEVWTEKFDSDEAARWLHFALTSSDVIDAATALQLIDTNSYLLGLASELTMDLNQVIDDLDSITQVGRTHGQWAQPRPAVNPLCALADMLLRQRQRLVRAAPDLAEVGFSGPTGGDHMIDPVKARNALRELDLVRMTSSTQITPRDGWVHWAHTVAGLVTVCEAIAEHYWMLAQSEIGEIEVVNGAGSSAMPHKRGNPHRAENIRGLARLTRALVSTLDESMVQRGDRDLAHSSVERVVFPDLAHLAATALTRTIEIVSDYRYVAERIEENLMTAMHERVDSAIAQSELVQSGFTRQDAIAATRKENP